MKHRTNVLAVLLITGLVCASACQAAAPGQSSYKDEVRAGLEEIYVFRTIRTQRRPGATPACAAAPFQSTGEDYYALWSIELRASDGRVVNTHKNGIGGFTACFSRLVPNQPVQMYATGTLAHIPWTGVGQCVVQKAQPPVRTAVAFDCTLTMSGLPEVYTGGFLASSTLAPFLANNPDPSAHVPGYLSTSVITVRLWKKPPVAAK